MRALLNRLFTAITTWFKNLSNTSTPQQKTIEIPKEKDVEINPFNISLKGSGWSREVSLPESGRFVGESHYLTVEDKALIGRYPKSLDEYIQRHMEYSVGLLRERGLLDSAKTNKEYMSEIYSNQFRRVWTPSEGGKIGQGARGEICNTAWDEMWQGNMMFRKLVPFGTKFLIENPLTGKAVVINMGLEVGPGGREYLGGVTPEVHWWLKSDNQTQLKLSYLKDQTLACGPITLPKEEVKPVEMSEISKSIVEVSLSYVGLKETRGKNRSPEIDGIIKRQGGNLGEAYCLYGGQDVLDKVAIKHNGQFDLPGGGGTQDFWRKCKSEYKRSKPAPGYGVLWRSKHNSALGHYGLATTHEFEGEFETIEFNTNHDGSRDGDGVWMKKRSMSGTKDLQLLGFVDLAAAFKKNVENENKIS